MSRFAKTKSEKDREEKEKTRPRQMIPTAKPLTAAQLEAQLTEVQTRLKIHEAPLGIDYWFPFDLPPLDCAINRGLPGGRLAEFSGPERTGKSTLAARLIKVAQEQGGRGDYFDLEMGTTPGQLRDMGGCSLEKGKFKHWTPDSAEQCFQAIDEIIPKVGSTGYPSVIVLDSIPGLVSINELLADFTDETQLAMEARLLKKFCRKNMVRLGRFPKVLVVLINHLNTPFKVGMFEKPEPYTSGGKSPRYYSTVRLRFEGTGGTETIETPGGKVVARENPRIFLWKNRVGSAHRSVMVPINFLSEKKTLTRKGFDQARCCLEFLKAEKVLIHPKSRNEETGEEKTATSYWCLAGLDEPNRYMVDWIRLYNSDERVKTLIDECVVEAARAKWTPDEEEWDVEEVADRPMSLEDLAHLEPAGS